MNERLARIRDSERKSHTEIYTSEKLYQSNSWLRGPIKTVREIIPLFDGYEELRVLDLGCGVGRNSIYVAAQFREIACSVDCVDLLDIAIEKLLENAEEHKVSSGIKGILASIEEYQIPENTYDFIMAISALEHIDAPESFLQKIVQIRDGVKKNGIVCLIINSGITEMRLDTKEPMEAQFEVNLPTDAIQAFLDKTFLDWEIIKTSVVPQQYDVPRESFVSRINTNVITYVARQSSGHPIRSNTVGQ